MHACAHTHIQSSSKFEGWDFISFSVTETLWLWAVSLHLPPNISPGNVETSRSPSWRRFAACVSTLPAFHLGIGVPAWASPLRMMRLIASSPGLGIMGLSFRTMGIVVALCDIRQALWGHSHSIRLRLLLIVLPFPPHNKWPRYYWSDAHEDAIKIFSFAQLSLHSCSPGMVEPASLLTKCNF